MTPHLHQFLWETSDYLFFFRTEHVENGQGDVWCGYIERNRIELSRTHTSQGCRLVCNIIKIQLSLLFSLRFLSEMVKAKVSLLMKSWGPGVTGISRLEGCSHTENAWFAIFPILVDHLRQKVLLYFGLVPNSVEHSLPYRHWEIYRSHNLGFLLGPSKAHSLFDVLYSCVHTFDAVISISVRLSFLGKYLL